MPSARSTTDLPRVEPMRTEDMADVLAIDAASFQTHRATETQLAEELLRPWSHLWVARRESRPGSPASKPTAFIIVWHVVDELHVLNVATDPEFRRLGHARALLDRTIEFARAENVRLVALEVRRSNAAAILLYRALGFFAMGIRRAYYSDGEDAIEMMLMIDPETKEILARVDEVRIFPPKPE